MIDWDMILGHDDHAGVLAGMYETRSLEGLGEHLGVSETALKRKVRLEGVSMRCGKINRFDRISNGILESSTPKKIAEQFDVDLSSVYRNIRCRGLRIKKKVPGAEN